MHGINFNELDSTVHGPVRLGILTTLHAEGPKDFSTLKDVLVASDGALGMHLAKLEEAGFLKCQKSFVARRPKSTYTITPEGRSALLKYVDMLQAIVEFVRTKGRGDLEK